ncbi:hypothetical protein [Tsukamurella sp. PLM1]|uniref:hypothetical protein n=1 Tax=Tsukamurella sp. PLM1 TaxID=2929795 RepID=UPI002067C5D7|nr:hypothetical protein [Tsukamurella sp. PLM1]BDH56693.1 hypothetical protein MTP03_16320 [Tsukamurella sp. PLM1]
MQYDQYMESFVSLRELAARLDVGHTVMPRLVEAGVVRDVAKLGKRSSGVPEEEALRLEAIPYVTEVLQPTLVVRIAGDTDWQDDDAIRQWWPVKNPDLLVGGLLVTTVVGFVLRADQITGYSSEYGRRSFDIRPSNGDLGMEIRGRRFKTSGGSLTQVWNEARTLI